MIDAYIERLFDDPKFPSLEIAIRFNSLQRYLDLLLEFVPHMQEQTLVRFKADIQRKAGLLSAEDLADEIEHTKSLIEGLIPLNFYGAFVLALFAALERSITDLANYVKEKEASPLSLRDLREQGTIKQLTLYLKTLLKQPLGVSQPILDGLRGLQLVRNVLAHANGSLADQPKDRLEELQRMTNSFDDIKIEGSSLVLYAQFLSRNLVGVEEFLTALLQQLADRYPVSADAS